MTFHLLFCQAKPMSFSTTTGSSRRGGVVLWTLLCLVGLGAAGWYGFGWSFRENESAKHDAVLHTIERNDFELVVTERGTIESSGSTEIRSQVQATDPSGVSILRIIEEGAEVEEGDFLVELDASSLLSDRTLQKVKVNTAEAAQVEAKNKYETALIAREEYLHGKFVQERQTFQSEVFVKEEDVSRAEEYLAYSRKLAAKGYINDLQLEADQFAVEKSKTELEAAKTKLRVLEKYTKLKEMKTLDSEILITKAKWEADQNSYELEVSRLAAIEDQIEKCLILAPRAGTIKYAHGNNQWNNNDFVVEEGAKVRERQIIIRLPDVTKMQVEVLINESLIQHIKKGMAATISPVGSEDKVLKGEVIRVNQYAEPSNWRRANVKDYKVIIRIDESSDIVKTGMTVSASISSMFVPDTIQAPVESVYAHGDKFFCFVDSRGKLEPREVACGLTNDRFFVVNSGLKEGDRVAMNPRRLLAKVALPELPPEQLQQAVDSGKAGRRLRERLAKKSEGDTSSGKQGVAESNKEG